MNNRENEEFEIVTDFIGIRQERIDDIVAATKAGLDVGNIDLTYVEKLTEAKSEQAELFEILDGLKDNLFNEQEKETIKSEFQKILETEREAK